MAGDLRISLLGRVAFEQNGTHLAELTSTKGRALLVYLAVSRQPHSRQKLAGLLWPDVLEDSARSSLRVTLMQLRKALGDQVTSTRQAIGLDPERPLWLDAHKFERACQRLQSRRADQATAERQRLRQAVHLYQGDFLTDFPVPDALLFEEWAVQQREHYRRLALESFTLLAQAALRCGELTEGLQDATRLLEIDPLYEEGYRLQMQLLAQRGERSAALKQFETGQRLLADALGVEPDAATVALAEQIRRDEPLADAPTAPVPPTGPVLPTGPVPPAGVAAPPIASDTSTSNTLPGATTLPGDRLPVPATPFVGRSEELADLLQRLHNPACRLLSLVGPGGIGKTRLALEAARRLHTEDGNQDAMPFANGIVFVPLQAVEDADGLVSALIQALNFHPSGGSPLREQLLDSLHNKALLLVLDNFEQLLASVELLPAILAHAPQVKILVTTRAALKLQQEWFYPLAGLRYVVDAPPQRAQGERDAAEVEASAPDAVQLFAQLARRAQPHFSLAAEIDHVLRVCQLVSGMPLGIELAASWVRTLPLAQIVSEVQAGLDFLASPLRDVSAAHRSMRAVFDRSWRLLDEETQQTLARLAVFRGGFTREAAESIADASLPILSNLIDSSWLQLGTSGRYDLHELVRQYAAERLEALPGEPQAVQRRHADFYGTLAENQIAHLGTRQQKHALDATSTELENMWSGWRWIVANLEVSHIQKYAECLKWLANTRSRYHSVLPEFERAIHALRTRLADATAPSSLQRQVSLVLATLLYQQAHMYARAVSTLQALPLATESLTLLRVGDFKQMEEVQQRVYLKALAWSCFVARMAGKLDLATEWSSEVVRLVKGHPQYQAEVGRAVICLANVADDRGRFEEASRLYRTSITYMYSGTGAALSYLPQRRLARLHYDAGRFQKALAMIEEAARSAEQVDNRSVKKHILHLKAEIAMAQGEFEAAKQLLAQLHAILEKTDVAHARFTYLLSQAQLARLLGEPLKAEALYREAAVLTEPIGRPLYYIRALIGLGYATLDQNAYGEARTHFCTALQAAWESGFLPEVLDAVAGLTALKGVDDGWAETAEWLAVVTSHPACRYQTQTEVAKILTRLKADDVVQETTLPAQPNPEPVLEQIVEGLLAHTATTLSAKL